MMRNLRTRALLTAGLMLLAAARLVWAGERAPTISGVEVTQVWGSVYKLSALVATPRGTVQAAEYRVGLETGSLFASDGMLDSREELVETYLDIAAGQEVAVRAQAGGNWSDWQAVEGPGNGPDGPAGCTMSAVRGGARGWYRGDVAVDCAPLIRTEGADHVEYSLGFGDWTPAPAGFTLTEEGVHWVQIRSVNADGVAGLPSTFTVAIDKTAPRLFMQNPPGDRMTHSEMLYLDFAAEDEISGVESVVADMNGDLEIMAGMPVELWQLPLGKYSLSVYARDRAGNSAASPEPVELEITATGADLAKLVQLFSAKGKVDSYTGLKGKLLSEVEKAEASLAKSDLGEARAHLTRFVEAVQQGMAEGLVFETEGQVLQNDATWLMAHLEDDSFADPPSWN